MNDNSSLNPKQLPRKLFLYGKIFWNSVTGFGSNIKRHKPGPQSLKGSNEPQSQHRAAPRSPLPNPAWPMRPDPSQQAGGA